MCNGWQCCKPQHVLLFKSSGIWRRVDWQIVVDVSEQITASICRVHQHRCDILSHKRILVNVIQCNILSNITFFFF